MIIIVLHYLSFFIIMLRLNLLLPVRFVMHLIEEEDQLFEVR